MLEAKVFRLPGLVDMHVHLRDPGATHKEDFLTGTAAALAGGYTMVFDMPNTPGDPTVSDEALERKLDSARAKIFCDVGFYFGSFGDNLDQFEKIRSRVRGIKLYGLTNKIGDYDMPREVLRKIYRAWSDKERPVLIHAEADMVRDVMAVAEETGQRTHICHISSREELEPVLKAKNKGLPVTCGVTPHHLFLNDADVARLGVFGRMKPELKPQRNVNYFWDHFDDIDVVESDHAPHTRKEKEAGAFGVPGLETTLPLMLQAEREGRVTRKQIIEKCHSKHLEILGLTAAPDTYIEVDPVEFEITNESLKTKSGWTPFAGQAGFGRVIGVTLRGIEVYRNGQVLALPGSGKIV